MEVAIAPPVGDQESERMLGARPVGRPVSARTAGLMPLKVVGKRSFFRGREVFGGAMVGLVVGGVGVFGGGGSALGGVLGASSWRFDGAPAMLVKLAAIANVTCIIDTTCTIDIVCFHRRKLRAPYQYKRSC